MTVPTQKGVIYRIGNRVSAVVSDIAAHPLVQLGVVLFCVVWFTLKLPTDLLTAALSILAITLTQMVLNRQNEREADAHQRDVAMHAKLDELVIATRRARDEMAGIEDLSEDEIVQLKKHAREATDKAEKADHAAPARAREQ